jgi:hypothetical protein
LREFQADAQLRFELPGRIRCRAASDTEARELITGVIRHNRPAPPGFAVTVDGEALDQFTERLECAMRGGRDRTLGVLDVVTGVLTERRLLPSLPSPGPVS